MKKIITLVLLGCLWVSYTSPAFAIQIPFNNSNSTQQKTEKKKDTKIKPVENKFDYINLDWWQNFNDEQLNGYIIKAVENNKDLKMATLTIDEYYQNITAQRANEMPSIYTGFMPAYTKLNGKTGGNFGLPLIATYEIDLFGKNHNKTTSVRKLWESTIIDERAAYISIASAVGSTYTGIVKLDAMIDLQQEIVDLRKDIFEIMSVSNFEGIVSASDLVKANKSYIAGVTDLTELKKQRTKLLHQLAVLIGDSPNNIEEYKRISYKNFGFQGNIPVSVSSDVIMQRPDYMKAEKMLEKAGIDVKIARKEMLPSITLGGGVFFNNKYLESLFTTKNMIWGIGGGLIQPAFMGGKLRANLKSKKIAYEKSLKNYEKVNLTSMQEVNDALVSVNMDKEKLSKQKTIQSLEKKDFALTQQKYKEGVISKLDLEQMQENLLTVNKMVYDTEFSCLIDYINYYKAVGAKG